MKYSLSIPQQSSFPQLTTFSSGFAKSDIHKIVDHIASQWLIKKSCSRSKVFSELTIAERQFCQPFSFSIIFLSVTAIVALSAIWKVIIHFSKTIVLKVFANRETEKQKNKEQTRAGRRSWSWRCWHIRVWHYWHVIVAPVVDDNDHHHLPRHHHHHHDDHHHYDEDHLHYHHHHLQFTHLSVLQKQTSAKVASCSGMSTKEMLVHLFSTVPCLRERVLLKQGEFGAFVGRWCWWLCWMLVHLFSAPCLIERMLLRNMKPYNIIFILIINFTCHKWSHGSQKTLQPRSSRSRGVPCKNKTTSLQQSFMQLPWQKQAIFKPWPKHFHLLSICDKKSWGC